MFGICIAAFILISGSSSEHQFGSLYLEALAFYLTVACLSLHIQFHLDLKGLSWSVILAFSIVAFDMKSARCAILKIRSRLYRSTVAALSLSPSDTHRQYLECYCQDVGRLGRQLDLLTDLPRELGPNPQMPWQRSFIHSSAHRGSLGTLCSRLIYQNIPLLIIHW